MQQENDTRKLERRAKALLLNKNIPSSKMEIVRSLMKNTDIPAQERYNAIIELVKSCDDKPKEKEKNKETLLTEQRGIDRSAHTQENDIYAPIDSNYYINDIYKKYKNLKLFRKRYLIISNNKLGVGIKKRLIPSKRLMKAIREIVAFQEKILTRLPDILMEILKDESIDDATHFNYLRIFRRWMMETPIVKYSFEEVKWMDVPAFESEIQSYIINLFSFLKMNIELKEEILLQAESKLRNLNDLKKEEVSEEDSQSLIKDKEKQNLAKEKQIYEYMMIMRSFLPSKKDSESIISNNLRIRYGIESFPEFFKIIAEGLIFQKDITLNNIISYYNIITPSVSCEIWDYSSDFLKTVGKDAESRKEKQIERLKKDLIPFNELLSFLKLKSGGSNVLQRAFETQCKIDKKKQKDLNAIYENNFFAFIEECINYFNNTIIPFINGSKIYFENNNNGNLEGNIFNIDYFCNEIKNLSDLLNEIHFFRTNNPSLVVSRDEVMKILDGKIPSMSQVEKYILHIGDLFYSIGSEMHQLYDQHLKWIRKGSKTENPEIIRQPLKRKPEVFEDGNEEDPIPFHDYKVIEFADNRILSNELIGKKVISDSLKGGIIIYITAFSYQLAYECMNEKILAKSEERKNILRKIKELEG